MWIEHQFYIGCLAVGECGTGIKGGNNNMGVVKRE